MYAFCFLVIIFLGILGVGYGYKGVDVGLVFVYASIIFFVWISCIPIGHSMKLLSFHIYKKKKSILVLLFVVMCIGTGISEYLHRIGVLHSIISFSLR